METSLIATSNVTSFTDCVLELVSNSLNANATAIAIRIHTEQRKIQVVDNGRGIPKNRLKNIAEYNSENARCNYWNAQDICNSREQTLMNIRRLSNAMLITSRYHSSSKTYMKMFKVCHKPNIVKVQRRPTCGTTVSIYGFHELSLNKWNIPFMYHLIANIAIGNLQVSFSIRDDQEKKVIMTIGKPHSPVEIIQVLYQKEILLNNLWYIKGRKISNIKYCAYIGLANSKFNATQYAFLNNAPVYCPLVLQMISTTFITALYSFKRVKCKQVLKRKIVFILLFITCTKYIFSIEKGRKTLILSSIQDFFHNIRNEIVNIFAKNITPLPNDVSRCVKSHKNLISNYKNNLSNVNLFKKSPIVQQPCTPQKNHIIHTFCHIINRKIIKVDVPQIHEDRTNKLNAFKEHRFNQNNIEYKITTNQLTISKMANTVQLSTPTLQKNNVIKENFTLSLSEWSNWTYSNTDSYNLKKRQVSEINKFDNSSLNFYKRFDFLPKKLHKLLHSNTKLTKLNILNDSNENQFPKKLESELQNALRHQEMDVRPCKTTQQFHEFRLKKEHLKFINVLTQINNELIVGLITENDMKVLLLMDQHAIHERIRYENLLHKYKSQTRNQLLSIKLKDPIILELLRDQCTLLLSNKTHLKKFGINLDVVNDKTVIVHTVPECLKKNKYHYNEIKLKLNVQNLLNELMESFTSNKYFQMNYLPLTIHNVIAMEACHGAIKFGDPLTLRQCKFLLKLLNETKIPTRCAHGRPSIIPILELSELGKRHRKIIQLNWKNRSLNSEYSSLLIISNA